MATNLDHQSVIDLLTTTLDACQSLHTAAHDGNSDEVWRLIRAHTNMALNRVLAADVADAAGHTALGSQLRDLWAHVTKHRGYVRYYRHLQAQHARWLILRERFRKRIARNNFARAVLVARERTVLDWLLVGTNYICPDDVLSVIMGYWGE